VKLSWAGAVEVVPLTWKPVVENVVQREEVLPLVQGVLGDQGEELVVAQELYLEVSAGVLRLTVLVGAALRGVAERYPELLRQPGELFGGAVRSGGPELQTVIRVDFLRDAEALYRLADGFGSGLGAFLEGEGCGEPGVGAVVDDLYPVDSFV